jgi:hypothetical protein
MITMDTNDHQPPTWTVDELRSELARWKQQLKNTTGLQGQPYSPYTISTHIGHSRQFISWLAGEWQPQGPRLRGGRQHKHQEG